MRLSVIICTHSPRPHYFNRTLEALRAQTLPKDQWELLVIDNRSTDPLQDRTDLSWHPDSRIVREETLGLTPARLAGIKGAKGELFVFVDDDNVLDEDYLEQALKIAQAHPFLGAWSGQCRGGFEKPPAEWTRRYWGNLVIREFDRDVWSNLPRLGETMPCGAGMVVRAAAAREYLRLTETGERGFQLDRAGGSLLSGGDNDLAACAIDIGMGMGLFTALKLTHLIPPERFTEAYLSKLAEGIYISSVVLAHVRGDQAELASYRVRRRDWVRAMMHRGPHRTIQLAAVRGRQKGFEFIASMGTDAA